MKWQQACAIVLGAVMSWLSVPSVGRAGWITLTSGTIGNAQPTGASEFWYGSASTPPLIAIDTLSGVGPVQAATGGGTVYFGGLGTPVLLHLSDGAAYVASDSPPAGTTSRGPAGVSAGALASRAPRAGTPIASDVNRLGIVLTPPVSTGAWVLTASVLGSDSALLGSGTIAVPDGGWWVLGLGSDQEPQPEPLPNPTPIPLPEPIPSPSPVPGVPEPATGALVASGVTLALPWVRRKMRGN